MSAIWKLPTDFAGLCRVCGLTVALRWLWCIAVSVPQILRSHNLQPADRAMGSGPFLAKRGGVRAYLEGEDVISSIREMWVRDSYLKEDFLAISPGDSVVDLGANRGRFTMLALAHGSGVRVVAVEPGQDFVECLLRTAGRNGWEDRVHVVRALLGGKSAAQESMLQQTRYAGVRFMEQAEFIEHEGIERIDFLKCDIEGSEFELLTPDSPLLDITRQLAIEIHADAGDPNVFLEMLKGEGFEIGPVQWDGGSCVALAKRRTDAEVGSRT